MQKNWDTTIIQFTFELTKKKDFMLAFLIDWSILD